MKIQNQANLKKMFKVLEHFILIHCAIIGESVRLVLTAYQFYLLQKRVQRNHITHTTILTLNLQLQLQLQFTIFKNNEALSFNVVFCIRKEI